VPWTSLNAADESRDPDDISAAASKAADYDARCRLSCTDSAAEAIIDASRDIDNSQVSVSEQGGRLDAYL